MLVIAGGILLAIILLPLLAPALFVGAGALIYVLPIAGLGIAVGIIGTFYEDHKRSKETEKERLSKMTNGEIEAEKKRKKEQREEDLRRGICAAGITFVVVLLIGVMVGGPQSFFTLVVMPAIFSAIAFFIGMTLP